jgi:hypothetical protein
MPRKKNQSPTTKFKISTTPQLAAYLETMVNLGIWGKTRSEVGERLIGAQIERLIHEGLLTLKKPEGR